MNSAEVQSLEPEVVFNSMDGVFNRGLPVLDSKVYKTDADTPYLKHPGVAMISRPHVDLGGMAGFLAGFDPDLGFMDYLADPTRLPDSAQLCKAAGQTCYASFGPKHTVNENADRYFDNIISSGHGSVLEHANFSFLLYGVSRSITHELVRHRAGMGYSQISQRYVDGSKLRFVERPEYQRSNVLHRMFEIRIDKDREDYEFMAEMVSAELTGGLPTNTDERKKVNQTARSLLPNETEAPCVVTGNVRAWRHILGMRGNTHAETEIRNLATRLFLCFAVVDPILFGDFILTSEPDGTLAIASPNAKA